MMALLERGAKVCLTILDNLKSHGQSYGLTPLNPLKLVAQQAQIREL
jgi:hypothetical protein